MLAGEPVGPVVAREQPARLVDLGGVEAEAPAVLVLDRALPQRGMRDGGAQLGQGVEAAPVPEVEIGADAELGGRVLDDHRPHELRPARRELVGVDAAERVAEHHGGREAERLDHIRGIGDVGLTAVVAGGPAAPVAALVGRHDVPARQRLRERRPGAPAAEVPVQRQQRLSLAPFVVGQAHDGIMPGHG